MADIAKCIGVSCPLKESCYRYTATPSDYWQSYFMSIPYDNDKESCDNYWKDTETDDDG